MHYFPGMDEETVLWKVSYTNLNMYLATIPTYEGTDEEKTSGVTVPNKEEDAKLKEIKNFFAKT